MPLYAAGTALASLLALFSNSRQHSHMIHSLIFYAMTCVETRGDKGTQWRYVFLRYGGRFLKHDIIIKDNPVKNSNVGWPPSRKSARLQHMRGRHRD